MKIPRPQCSFSSRLILVRSQSRHALHTSRISTTIQRQLRRISTIHKYTDECKSKYSTHSVVVANLTKRNFVLFENGKSKHDHPKTAFDWSRCTLRAKNLLKDDHRSFAFPSPPCFQLSSLILFQPQNVPTDVFPQIGGYLTISVCDHLRHVSLSDRPQLPT